MKTLLIIIGVLLFINLLPIGGHIILNESGFVLKLVFGLIQIRILPRKDKPPTEPSAETEDAYNKRRKEEEKRNEQKRKKSIKKLQKPDKPKEKPSIGVLIDRYIPLVRLAARAISDIRWLPTIRKLDMTVSFGGDSAKAAMSYGTACGIIGAGLAILRRNIRIRSYHIHPEADDGVSGVRILADAVVTLTLGGLLGYLLKYLFRAVPVLIHIKKSGKVGTRHESSTV